MKISKSFFMVAVLGALGLSMLPFASLANERPEVVCSYETMTGQGGDVSVRNLLIYRGQEGTRVVEESRLGTSRAFRNEASYSVTGEIGRERIALGSALLGIEIKIERDVKDHAVGARIHVGTGEQMEMSCEWLFH